MPLNQTANYRTWLTDLAWLGLGLLFFYSLWLGSYPLFTPDEGRYTEVAREMVASGDFITPRVDGVAFLDKPVLYYWLQAVAISLFGIHEWAIRLFPMLLGIMTCLVTYACGRSLFNRRTGLLAALILASSPLFFGGAHYADLNIEVAAWISCSLLCFITGIQQDGRARFLLMMAAYFSAACAFLTKGLIGLAFPGLIIGAWLAIAFRFDLIKKMHLILGLLLFIALVLPWYVLVQQANPEFLHYFFVTQQVSRFLSSGEFNNKTPFWFYLPVVLVGFFPWTIFLFQTLKKHIQQVMQARSAHLSELFLLLWAGIIFVFFSIPSSKTVGYIFPVFPALALLTARYLSLTWQETEHNRAALCLVVLSTLLGGVLLALPYIDFMDFSPHLMPYLLAMAITMILGGLLALCLMHQPLFPLILICFACNALFLSLLTSSARYLNTNSTKSLAVVLKEQKAKEDEVVAYYRYYQDLPLYLGERITIVADWQSPDIAKKDNWEREMWLGMPFQKTDDWLINEDKFWKRFRGDERVFVLVSNNYLDQFKREAKRYYHFGEYNGVNLFSNQLTLED